MRVILLLVLSGAFCALVEAGDPEVAKFLFDKARKEARAKRYDDAEVLFRRAIAEHPPYPEASCALGDVLEKLGRTQDAVAAYQACIAAVNDADSPTSKWKSACTRAARAVTKLRRKFAAMDRVNRDYAQKFFVFGKSQLSANPRWARRALETVLAIDPTHKGAKALLKRLPKADGASPKKTAPSKGKPWGKALIRDGTLKNFEAGETEFWTIDGSVVTGKSEKPTPGQMNWIEDVSLSGEYSLRVKFRRVWSGPRPVLGIFIGGKDWWGALISDSDDLELVRFDRTGTVVVGARPMDGKKWTKWHTLRVDVSKDKVEVFVDGKRHIESEVPRDQPFAGQVALFVQNAKVEFKELELKK